MYLGDTSWNYGLEVRHWGIPLGGGIPLCFVERRDQKSLLRGRLANRGKGSCREAPSRSSGRRNDGKTQRRCDHLTVVLFLLYKSGENRPNGVRLSTRVFRCLGKSPGICQGVETWEILDKRTFDSQVLPKRINRWISNHDSSFFSLFSARPTLRVGGMMCSNKDRISKG